MSIRAMYQVHGVSSYYQTQGNTYKNPHEPSIRTTLMYLSQNIDLKVSSVIDLACGSGEVTKFFQDINTPTIYGIDPYTGDAYKTRTGLNAERWTFEQIGQGNLNREIKADLIVCSYALHLAPVSYLPKILYQLKQMAPRLLILSPNKKPEIHESWGWKLDGEEYLNRVRCRWFSHASA